MHTIQADTLEFDQAVALVKAQARAFTSELDRDGSRGTKGVDALEYDLAVAHLDVLRRRGLLPAADVEGAALTAILLQQSERPFEEIPLTEATELLTVDVLEVERLLDRTRPYSSLEPDLMSEVETKLDLARAYMDVGDPEGARSILEEVMQVESEAKDKILELARELEKSRG